MSSEHKILARIPISVRWRDMDSMGHVNNAKYISYLDRIQLHLEDIHPQFSGELCAPSGSVDPTYGQHKWPWTTTACQTYWSC